MNEQAIVVVGLAASDVVRRGEVVAAAETVGGRHAFLQMGEPSLATVLSAMADAGHSRIALVGLSLGPLPTLAPAASWVRRIAAYWWRERPGDRPDIEVAVRAAHDVESVVQVLADRRALVGDEPGLESAAWSEPPRARHRLYVCRGPRCTAKGAEAAVRALILATMEAGLGDDDVVITHTGCQAPCNLAPVVSVQPSDAWHGPVDDVVARSIVSGLCQGPNDQDPNSTSSDATVPPSRPGADCHCQ